ncbi:MAG TPA: acetyltransferase [Thermoanaerobaculia bacterium]|nr:acetyltransferase [Thermoanaerobaculia bacterium]
MAANKLVILGDGEFAGIVHDYLTRDSDYQIVAFAVEREYLRREELFGLPVVALEDLERLFSPVDHQACVAVTHVQLNRVRARLFRVAKSKGYRMASYISSRSSVSPKAVLGEHCLIFEFNVIQYHATIGDNVLLWTFNHVGHRAVVGSHSFVTAHVVVAGYTKVGESCFLGSGAVIGDSVTVGNDAVIGAGAVVLKDVSDRQVMRGNPATHAGIDSLRIFRVPSE